jgi:hypothetical protein
MNEAPSSADVQLTMSTTAVQQLGSLLATLNLSSSHFPPSTAIGLTAGTLGLGVALVVSSTLMIDVSPLTLPMVPLPLSHPSSDISFDLLPLNPLTFGTTLTHHQFTNANFDCSGDFAWS